MGFWTNLWIVVSVTIILGLSLWEMFNYRDVQVVDCELQQVVCTEVPPEDEND